MIELALIRSLMQKDFYEDHKGSKCPDRLFSKDTRKIKNTLDEAMGKHERNLSLTELQALFFSDNGTMTSANKASFEVLFSKLSKEEPMNNDIAKEVLSKLFQQMVGEEVANIGFDYVNGTKNNLEPLRNILDNYQDDFTPSFRFEGDDISFDTVSKRESNCFLVESSRDFSCSERFFLFEKFSLIFSKPYMLICKVGLIHVSFFKIFSTKSSLYL